MEPRADGQGDCGMWDRSHEQQDAAWKAEDSLYKEVKPFGMFFIPEYGMLLMFTERYSREEGSLFLHRVAPLLVQGSCNNQANDWTR